MKKTVGRTAAWAVIVCAMVLLAGCGNLDDLWDDTKHDPPEVFQWDASLPRKETAIVSFYMFYPKSYNQMPFPERKKTLGPAKLITRLPPGPAAFTGDILWETGMTTASGNTSFSSFYYKDASVAFNLEAGKYYIVDTGFEYVDQVKKKGKKMWVLYIKKYEEKHFNVFIPFNPPVISD